MVAAAASLVGLGAPGAPGHRARCGHLCPVARGRWAQRPGSWLRPAPCEARPARARGGRERARGGPGARALTGRGPRAQSPCPSRWRGEETRGGGGGRQSRRRRLLLLPRVLLARPGHSGVGARGRLPAVWSRLARGWSGELCPPLPGTVCATRHRAPSESGARRPAAQCNRVRRLEARQPAAGRRALASPASRSASRLSPGTARAASRAPAKQGGSSAPRASARIARAKCAGLGTFPRLEPGQRHSWLRGPTPRGRSLDVSLPGRWDL